MSKIVRIKENHLFRRAYKKGKTLVSPYVAVYYMKNRTNNIRLGITAGKKIGGAVLRNRAKRLIRAAFISCLPNIPQGYDFIIVARMRILNVKSTVVAESLVKALKSAELYINSEKDENITD